MLLVEVEGPSMVKKHSTGDLKEQILTSSAPPVSFAWFKMKKILRFGLNINLEFINAIAPPSSFATFPSKYAVPENIMLLT